jgi:uncharacterized protein
MNDFLSFFPAADSNIHLALAMGAVVAAYALFTLVGFGSALLASGPLALVMPVAKVVPMLAILDFAGSSLRGWQAHKEVSWADFRQLFPGMLLGQLIGVFLLAQIPAPVMAIILGLFVVSQGLRGLVRKGNPSREGRSSGLAHGVFGGVLGGLFGSGGFVYASYLERRLESRAAFRATQAVLIALSTSWRIVLCISVGLLDIKLALTAMVFVPAMAIGIYIGHHIDLRMSREQLFKLLNGLLIASGLSLISRFLT